jgi:hypothetical protein
VTEEHSVTLEDLERWGQFADAARAWEDGDCEPLYLYIEQHGIEQEYGEMLSKLLRNPRKRSKVAPMTSLIVKVTKTAIKVFGATPHGKGAGVKMDQVYRFVAEKLELGDGGVDIVKRYWDRYKKKI